MDRKKIIKFFEFKEKKEKSIQDEQVSLSSFHTNPIVKENLLSEFNNRKNKFKFEDLFK